MTLTQFAERTSVILGLILFTQIVIWAGFEMYYDIYPKPEVNKTQCFTRTIANVPMWHAAPCNGLINRHSGAPYDFSKM